MMEDRLSPPTPASPPSLFSSFPGRLCRTPPGFSSSFNGSSSHRGSPPSLLPQPPQQQSSDLGLEALRPPLPFQ